MHNDFDLLADQNTFYDEYVNRKPVMYKEVIYIVYF